MDLQIAHRYRTTRRIEEGAFAEVFSGIDLHTQHPVAIKLQSKEPKSKMLRHQYAIYKQLNAEIDFDQGIPKAHCWATTQDFNVIVLDLLGPSLGELLEKLGRFDLKTTLMLAEQMLKRLQFVHSKGYVHRDIKPENFVIGSGSNHKRVYLIDFGLAKKIINDGDHIKYYDGLQLVGTARYASINTHLGIHVTRRDDLEALIYMLIHMAKGFLPWVGLTANSRDQKYRMIQAKKIGSSGKELAKGLPLLGKWLDYARELGYDEAPDYGRLREEVREAMEEEELAYDEQFEWIVVQQKKSKLKE